MLRAADEYNNQGPRRGPLRLHVPGHKGGGGAPPALLSRWGPAIFRDDLTEVPGMDDLSAPSGAIEASQARTAASLGAAQAHYLVQGTSGGIMALLLGAAQTFQATSVVLPRLSHRALVSAVVLCGMRPVFVPVRFCRGVPCGIDLESAEEILSSAGPGTVMFDVYPNMYGVAHDLAALVRIASSRNIPLFVDGAHSGLFGLHDALPPAPLACGAQAVVVSAHKTMGSLGQSSLLLLGPEAPAELRASVAAALRLIQTTSPSYPLLISLESAVDHATSPDGRRRIGGAVACAAELGRHLRSAGLSTLQDALRPGLALDPLRVVIDAWELGESGFGAAERLRVMEAVQVEGADWRNVLAVLGLGDGPRAGRRLAEAVQSLFRRAGDGGRPVHDPRSAAGGPSLGCSRLEALYSGFGAGPWEASLDPRTAWFSEGEPVGLDAARGRVAGDALAPYPPGVPVVWPGEVIGAGHVEFLQTVLELGGSVHGLWPRNGGRAGRQVRVVR